MQYNTKKEWMPMKKKLLYIIWVCMAVLCIGLGTLETEDLLLQIPLAVLAVMFFVPGGFLLYDALTGGDRKEVLRIRWISVISLALTAVFLIAFVMAAAVGAAAADFLYDMLMIVSCPMVCGQHWLISLFLWSCLLSATFLRKDRK